mgnify:FL=1
MAEKFQKKKLNREEHKKMDNAVKYAKKGGAALITAGIVSIAIKTNGPKIISAAKNIITKV